METLTGDYVAAPRIPLDGTYNLRESGGYPAGAGTVRRGALFRSDALSRIDRAGARRIVERGVVRIIDLRDAAELRVAPTAMPAEYAETVHHPLFADAARLPGDGVPALGDVYRLIVTERVEALAGAVRLIADAPSGGVLVNCAAGKDRTGIVIATTLTAVGVPREQVIADYAASSAHLTGGWADLRLAEHPERYDEADAAVRELLTTSPAALLADTLAFIDDAHGGVDRMLLRNGLDDDALARLRRRLVA